MQAYQRRAWRFFGQVQGVGFRYRAAHAAAYCGVTGFVRNEEDGSVSMEVQGAPEAIKQMKEVLFRGRFIRIDRLEEGALPLLEDECSFEILDRWW